VKADLNIYDGYIKKCKEMYDTKTSIWIEVDVMCLRGKINSKMWEIAKNISFPYNKYIVVDSEGGDVLYALYIANKIYENKMHVIVDGICVSACANYILLAGKEKLITKKSIVGWHGGAAQFQYLGVAPELAWRIAEAREKERHFFIWVGVNRVLVDQSTPASTALIKSKPASEAWTYSTEQLKCFGVTGFIVPWAPRPDMYGKQVNCLGNIPDSYK
jgi:hypothetical protein